MKNPEIKKELNELSSFSGKKEKVNPFVVPENYFVQNEEQILSMVKDLPASFLTAEKGGTNPFHVPENYFAELPDKLLAIAKVSETKVISFPSERQFILFEWKRISAVASIAATLILFFSILKKSPELPGQKKAETDFLASVSAADIDRYVEENYSDADFEILIEQVKLPDEAFQTITPVIIKKADSSQSIGLPDEEDLMLDLNDMDF